MAPQLFDMRLRAMRRDRAKRLGPELFLHERAFEDCLERLREIRRPFQSALLLGCPNPDWPRRLRTVAEHVDAADPGPLFAAAAGGAFIVEDEAEFRPGAYDLVVALGTLDSVNDLPAALFILNAAMRPDSLLIGAAAGGDSLPQLRSAMRAADDVMGVASPHVHPRIEPPALAPLLSGAGFVMPVIDIDRVQVTYPSFARLVADLRSMGATNLLSERSRQPLNRAALAAASTTFAASGDGSRTTETFEILHFACWTPR